MPCRPLLSFSLQSCPPSPLRTLSRVSVPRCPFPRTYRVSRRAASQSSAAVAHGSPPSSDTKTPSVPLPAPLELKQILQGSADLLRKVVGPVEEGFVWARFADRAVEDLATKRRARIAIMGDRLSGARELVTALLEDPLDEGERRKAIYGRWDGRGQSEVLKIRHGLRVNMEKGALTLPCNWLSHADADVYEIITSDPLAHFPLLLTTDALLLVTDSTRLLSPIQSLLPHLPIPPLNPSSLQLVINRTANLTFAYTPQEEDARLQAALEDVYRGSPHPAVTRVSSTLALEALDAFHAVSGDPAAETEKVRTFQSKYVVSRVSALQSSLSHPLPADFQLHTALRVASGALSTASIAVLDAEQDAEDGKRKAWWLMDEAEREAAKWTDVGAVKEEVAKSEEMVKQVLDGFAFWKLPWKVDDLGAEVREAVDRTYGRALERTLSYDTGRLLEIQSHVDTQTIQTLDTFAKPEGVPAPFHSPLLHNRLAQLTSITTLAPSSLLSPLDHRRSQFGQRGGPVDHLHLRAQKLVVAGWCAFLGASVLGYAGWIAWSIPGPTVVAVVGLLWTATVWWAQGRWRSHVKRFWADWVRVESGLEFDLRIGMQQLVKDKVLVKPIVAAGGIQELVARRERMLKPWVAELRTLQKRLEDVLNR